MYEISGKYVKGKLAKVFTSMDKFIAYSPQTKVIHLKKEDYEEILSKFTDKESQYEIKQGVSYKGRIIKF